MRVVFIHGPAAAGKHTIGSRLSDKIGLPLFHNHLTVDLAHTLFDFGTEEFVNLRSGIWKQAFAEAANAGRSFIFTFHPEATVEPALIQDLVGIIEGSGGRIHFVELRCSEEAILERLGNESRRKFGKLVDGDLYQQILAGGGFDFPELPSPLIVIDTDESSPEEAARKIQSALREAAVPE